MHVKDKNFKNNFAILQVTIFKLNSMPKISFKGATMPESPIRKLVPYAEDAKKGALKFFI